MKHSIPLCSFESIFLYHLALSMPTHSGSLLRTRSVSFATSFFTSVFFVLSSARNGPAPVLSTSTRVDPVLPKTNDGVGCFLFLSCLMLRGNSYEVFLKCNYVRRLSWPPPVWSLGTHTCFKYMYAEILGKLNGQTRDRVPSAKPLCDRHKPKQTRSRFSIPNDPCWYDYKFKKQDPRLA